MATLKSNKLEIVATDTANEQRTYTISNINPAITSTATLAAAARKINSLTNLSIDQIFAVQTYEISGD